MHSRRVGVGVVMAITVTIALLLAQALGLEHRIEHAPGIAQASDGDAHDPDEAECRLYDQLAGGDGVVASDHPFSAAALDAPAPVLHRAWQLAQQAAGALARGPPPIG